MSKSAWDEAPLIVGHRGGRGQGWPRENTLAAFEHARTQGARAIELDVRSWAGEVIVLHDAPRTAAADPGPDVPKLADVLAWARERGVAVNVEMKHDVPSRPRLAWATARLCSHSGADVLLSSFDPGLLAMAATVAPRLPRALLVHSAQARWASVLQERARPPLVQAIHLERTQTDPRAVRRYLRRGLRVGVWTVNDPGEARDLLALGAATIITDTVGDLLASLRS